MAGPTGGHRRLSGSPPQPPAPPGNRTRHYPLFSVFETGSPDKLIVSVGVDSRGGLGLAYKQEDSQGHMRMNFTSGGKVVTGKFVLVSVVCSTNDATNKCELYTNSKKTKAYAPTGTISSANFKAAFELGVPCAFYGFTYFKQLLTPDQMKTIFKA